MSTVIIGTGIIGLATAYYLSEHQPGSTIHLVDAAPELFSSCSGLSAGFLAREWLPPELLPLVTLSHKHHRSLAKVHDGRRRWGFCHPVTVRYFTPEQQQQNEQCQAKGGVSRPASAPHWAPMSGIPFDGPSPAWLRRPAGSDLELIAAPGSTALVDPLLLCRFLLDECRARGVALHQPARVLSVVRANAPDGELCGVVLQQGGARTGLSCTRVVISAGAWSARVFSELFPAATVDVPVVSLAGHSLAVTTPLWQPTGSAADNTDVDSKASCHAVFAMESDTYMPEVYARLPGNEIYVCAVNAPDMALPELAGGAAVRSSAMAILKATAERMVCGRGEGEAPKVVREAVCFRPMGRDGRPPVIARVPDEYLGAGMSTRAGTEGGVFLATAHGKQGINLSLGTGILVAEMAQGRATSVDVAPFAL